jgi:hypothetical protein
MTGRETMLYLCGCAFFVSGGLACSQQPPPLDVRNEDGAVVIDVTTLGEYQTSVTRFQLIIASTSTVVWEFVASSGTPQMWEVRLVSGENSAEPPPASNGKFRVSVPAEGRSFTLNSEDEYIVQVWGNRGRTARRSFRLVDGARSSVDRLDGQNRSEVGRIALGTAQHVDCVLPRDVVDALRPGVEIL